MLERGSLLHLTGREKIKSGSKFTLNIMEREISSWASRIFPKEPLQLASFPLPGQTGYCWTIGSGAKIWVP